jgi:hypothetical protein
MRYIDEHKGGCEGHITCPNCNLMCAKPVVWRLIRNRKGKTFTVVDSVVCLGCFTQFAVDESTLGRRPGVAGEVKAQAFPASPATPAGERRH